MLFEIRYVSGSGLSKLRPAAVVILVALAVILSLSVGQVWALTFNPNPPIAGQPFTVSGNTGGPSIPFGVFPTSNCAGGFIVFTTVATGVFTITVPGQPAGQYSISENGCVNFTIVPAAVPEYPLGLGLLAILAVMGYGIVQRRTRNSPH